MNEKADIRVPIAQTGKPRSKESMLKGLDPSAHWPGMGPVVSLENLKGWQSHVITVSDKQDTLSSGDQEHVQPSSPGTDSVLCHVSKLGHVGN